MIGLEYLCSLNNLTYSDLAKKIGVSKQTVTNWVAGRRNISNKYTSKLESIFNVSIDYIIKELDDIDILNLQKMQLENNATEFLYTDTVYNTVEDKKVDITNIYTDETEQAEIERMYFKIRTKEMLRDIEQYINLVAEDKENDDCINENIDKGIKLINIFNDLLSIIKNEDLDIKIVQDVLNGLKMSQEVKGDDNRFIRQVAAVIMQKRNDIKSKRTKLRKEYEFTKDVDEDLL